MNTVCSLFERTTGSVGSGSVGSVVESSVCLVVGEVETGSSFSHEIMPKERNNTKRIDFIRR